MALFYMSTNHNTRQLDFYTYLCNLLQCIVLVEVSEDNLASHRYMGGKRSASMAFLNNYGYSSLRNSSSHFLEVTCNLDQQTSHYIEIHGSTCTLNDFTIPCTDHVESVCCEDLPNVKTFQTPPISSEKSLSTGKFSTFSILFESLNFIISNNKSLLVPLGENSCQISKSE